MNVAGVNVMTGCVAVWRRAERLEEVTEIKVVCLMESSAGAGVDAYLLLFVSLSAPVTSAHWNVSHSLFFPSQS